MVPSESEALHGTRETDERAIGLELTGQTTPMESEMQEMDEFPENEEPGKPDGSRVFCDTRPGCRALLNRPPTSKTAKQKRSQSMFPRQTTKKALWVLLALLTSAGAALLCAAAAAAWEEMTHEGLTNSQWYQGAIESFSLAWLYAALSVQAALMLWYRVARALAKKPRRPVAWPSAFWPALCWALTALTAVLGVFAVQGWHMLAQAAASEHVCGAAAAFGRVRNAWVLAAELCALAWLKRLRQRRRQAVTMESGKNGQQKGRRSKALLER